ncbi:MAG: hypothetical protein ACK5L6_00440 [Anaerorhabdus sp.]|uniref:hypothetical protein n=1 Tax=Anaerorhabdus sp. TaxID=1872524 RepID=UPI003A86E95A
MVTKYSKDNCKSFYWDDIKSLINNDEITCDALSLLSNDQLIKIAYFDNYPFIISLEVTAIRYAEQNTKLKQVYEFLKEIRSWI